MRSTFFGLEIGRTGINVSQKALDVTGHNISNVDTPGYTRQRLINTAYDPYKSLTQLKPIDTALVGSGAKVIVLDQIRSVFLDRQYRTEASLTSYWNQRTTSLKYVEALLEDKSDGSITAGIRSFLSALNIQSTEANDSAQRNNIQKTAANLCVNFNLVFDRLVDQQKSQDSVVYNNITTINGIAQSIATLNKSIYTYEVDGQPANDLRDKRNLLLDQLSELVPIEYSLSSDNKLTVSIGGHELVNHLTTNELACVKTANPLGSGYADVWTPVWAQEFKDSSGSVGYAKLNITDAGGGELASAITMRDSTAVSKPGVAYFIDQLNNLARALAKLINEQHQAGFTHPSGTLGGSVSGVDFFYMDPSWGGDYTQVTAGNLRLSDEVTESVFNIAASSKRIVMDENDPDFDDPSCTHVGNNNNTLAMMELFARHNLELDLTASGGKKISVGGFEDFMDSIVLDIAQTLFSSKNMLSTKSVQLLAVDESRQSTSGVSLDEEMTNLIRFQHAYNGAARLITAMDEALDRIINHMGQVGLA